MEDQVDEDARLRDRERNPPLATEQLMALGIELERAEAMHDAAAHGEMRRIIEAVSDFYDERSEIFCAQCDLKKEIGCVFMPPSALIRRWREISCAESDL